MKKKLAPDDTDVVLEEAVADDRDQQITDAQTKYLRALADYQNLEKRMAVALEQARSITKKDIVGKFIGILDDLEKASVFVEDAGLTMIMGRFQNVLKECGVEEIAVEGMEFDPYVAEALEMVPGETDNIVAEVIRKGYRIGDTVIRPAQVKVTQHVSN